MAINDMILHYDFEAGSGDIITDRSTSGGTYDGTNNGASWVSAGGSDRNYLLYSDNQADWIDIPNSIGLFDGSVNFTVSLHFKAETLQDAPYLVRLNGENELYIFETIDDTIKVEWVDGSGTTHSIDTYYGIGTGGWTHIVVRYDTSGGFDIFLDNSLTKGADGTWTGTIQSASGDSSLDYDSTFLDFKWSDFRIYDRALTDTEVSDLYNAMPSYINVIEASTSPSTSISSSVTTLRERHPTSSESVSMSFSVTGNQIASGLVSEVVDLIASIDPKQITQAAADVASTVNISDTSTRLRVGYSGIEIVIDTHAGFGSKVAVEIDPQATIDPKKITQAQATVETVVDILADWTNIMKASGSVGMEVNTNLIPRRVRYKGAGISIDLSISAEEKRIRIEKSDIEIDVSESVNANAIYNAISQTEVAIETLAVLFNEGIASSEIGINVETIAGRIASGEASVDVELEISTAAELTKLIMSFTGDLAPGEEVEIDTENLTIEDGNGNNLRNAFEVIEWVQAHPDKPLTISYQDEEVSRNIMLEVSLQDKSI